jgi:peptidoglycan/LPS O-acetylase OafA/YrhL
MSSRLAGIEGVRGIAAMSVLGHHVWLYSSNRQGFGISALDVLFSHLRLGLVAFFMLSGFLLYRPFVAAALTQNGRADLRRYLRSRVLRIVPAYWAALAIVLALSPRTFDLGAIAKNFLFVQSYWSQTQWVIYPGWTLCVEMAFYAALPLIGWAVYAYASTYATVRDRAICCATIPSTFFLLAPLYKILAHARGWPTHALPAFLDQFAVGMLLAVALIAWRDAGSPQPRFLGSSLLTGAVLIGVLATSQTLDHPRSYMASAYGVLLYEPLMALAFALVLAFALIGERANVVSSFLSRRPAAWIGLISYGIYIWHSPIIHAIDATGSLATLAWSLPAVVGASLICAALSWYGVERYALALKAASRPRPGKRPIAATNSMSRPAHRT